MNQQLQDKLDRTLVLADKMDGTDAATLYYMLHAMHMRYKHIVEVLYLAIVVSTTILIVQGLMLGYAVCIKDYSMAIVWFMSISLAIFVVYDIREIQRLRRHDRDKIKEAEKAVENRLNYLKEMMFDEKSKVSGNESGIGDGPPAL